MDGPRAAPARRREPAAGVHASRTVGLGRTSSDTAATRPQQTHPQAVDAAACSGPGSAGRGQRLPRETQSEVRGKARSPPPRQSVPQSPALATYDRARTPTASSATYRLVSLAILGTGLPPGGPA